MATTIRNLPDELLVEILGKLLKKDLKSARLVCTLWSTAGAQWMFERVYFAPRKTSMKIFTDIAANPAFARNVKELVYDGRLFLPELSTFPSYYSAFNARMLEEVNVCGHYVRNCLVVDEANFAYDMYQDSVWNMETLGTSHERKRVCSFNFRDFDAIVINSLVRYARLLEQQESILTEGRDLKALSKGLSSFRNITTVSAVVDFDTSLIYDLHAGDRDDQYIEHHQWYSSRSYTEFGLTVPPSKWCRDVERGWWQHTKNKWDVRGIHSLFQAISTQSPRLQELRIGSMRYKAPMTIFQLSDAEIEKIATVPRGLTTLRLHPYLTQSDDDSEYARQRRCLGLLVREARGLRSLSSSGLIKWPVHLAWSQVDESAGEDIFISERPDFDLYLGKQWPHLTQLTLSGACMEARYLKSILWAHKESLRELSLRSIVFFGADGWDDFAMETGQILKLHFLSICRLYNEGIRMPCQTWPRGEQGFVLIRDMMRWAHPDELEIEESYGTFTGRLKASLKQVDE